MFKEMLAEEDLARSEEREKEDLFLMRRWREGS